MNYLNLETEIFRSEEFIGAEPSERAAWIALLGWCASQENSGVIENCDDWSCRKWQQLCGVTLAEIQTISKLYGFQNGNLMVSFYPVNQEKALAAKRSSGFKGGRPKKVNSNKDDQKVKPYGLREANHQGNVKEGNSKVKEGKGMESNNTPLPPKGDVDIFKSEINKLFNRREKTQWSDKEIKAYKKLSIDTEDMNLIQKYYDKETGCEYRRKDVITLLNNWQGELDRARGWTPSTAQGAASSSYTAEDGTIHCGGRASKPFTISQTTF